MCTGFTEAGINSKHQNILLWSLSKSLDLEAVPFPSHSAFARKSSAWLHIRYLLKIKKIKSIHTHQQTESFWKHSSHMINNALNLIPVHVFWNQLKLRLIGTEAKNTYTHFRTDSYKLSVEKKSPKEVFGKLKT